MTRRNHRSKSAGGFTLVELLVSMGILAVLVLLISQMFSSATIVTTTGNKQMDAEEQARAIFDRMQIDFTQMLKRPDLDYYLKQPTTLQAGNDQLAFFSSVTGYSAGTPGPVSLVSYRINSDATAAGYGKLERMAKGLLWNGTSTADIPVVFLPLLIKDTWPAAASTSVADADFDVAAPLVFRFEYWYLLKDGTVSITPWNVPAGSTAINGFQDVAALGVAIAVIDPKSKVLIDDTKLATLAGNLNDFQAGDTPGALEKRWQDAVNASTLPRPALSSIRIYGRYFYLVTTPKQ